MGGTSTTILTVPPGALVVLVGPAGSGKSTLAKRLFPSAAVLSSDTFRARIGTSEADQTVSRAAFAALHRDLETRLAARRTAVVDATSLTPAARSALLTHARAHGAAAIAIVLDLPPDLVQQRNAGRTRRVVPESAILRQLAMLHAVTNATLTGEGFRVVHRLRSDDDLAALRVEVEPG